MQPERLATFRLTALVLMAGCCGCQSADISSGRVIEVRGLDGRGILDIEAWSAGDGVVVSTTGPDARLFVLDTDWNRLGTCENHYTCIRVAPGGDYLCAVRAGFLDVDVLSLPDLMLRARVPAATEGLDTVEDLIPLAGQSAWAMIWHSSQLGRLRVGPEGVSGMSVPGGEQGPYVYASTQDQQTGRIVVVRAKNELCVFDPETLELESKSELPCERASFSAVAASGHVWVGTRDGQMLSFDLTTGRPSARSRLLPDGDVLLALSSSRMMLAAVATRRVRSQGFECELRLFRVSEGALSQVYSCSHQLDGPIGKIALLESRDTVLLGGVHGLVAIRVPLDVE